MVAHLVKTSALATVSRTTALSVSSIQAEKEGLSSNEDNKNCLTKIQATMQTEQTLKELAKNIAGGLRLNRYPHTDRYFVLLSEESVRKLVFLSLKKGYELGMEDAKEALKQQTNNKQTV